MAFYYSEPSHTFSEYLLVPGFTSEECVPDNVSLKTPLVKYRKGEEECPISLNIPMVSAIMQAVSNDTLAVALAMGADFLMLGRYFARFDESPTNKLMINGAYVKEYWGEGSNRARNWQRYDLGGKSDLAFEEGVDSYVVYAGALHDNVEKSLYKVKSTMCNCGVITIPDLQQNARLTLVSATSIVEGGYHDVTLRTTSGGGQ